jgi:hypothetical protein
MSFVNYDLLLKAYPNGLMRENILKLQKFDAFHCLLAGTNESANAVKKRVSSIPNDFEKWLYSCNGGMLFDTTLLSTKSFDDQIKLSFETFAYCYDDKFREAIQLPDSFFVFAIAVHSDLFCFDTKMCDGKVYQWDAENCEVYTAWNSFEDWLTDQINDAIDLIANEELEPLDIKLEDNDG